MEKISVYIPAYNAEEFLARCIDGLLKQTLSPDEILVIDDGSQDRTAEIAGSYAGVRLIAHGQNRGLGAARNTAFRSARNELVASLDADCVAGAEWLQRLAVNLEGERVAGAGGRLKEGVQDTLADRWRWEHMPQEWGDLRLEDPPFLFGCNNVLRKSAVVECGGYDEQLRTNGEDADLSRRLKAKGWKLIYDPTAPVTHWRHDTLESLMSTYWRWLYHGFEEPEKRLRPLKILRRALLGNVWHMFGGLARKDIASGRLEFLLVDFCLLFYFARRDLREWWKLSTEL